MDKKTKTIFPILNIIVLSLIVFSAALFLVGSNQISIKKYETIWLKEQIKDLESINQQLGVKIAEKQSMNNLEEYSQNLGLVKVDKVEYLNLEKEVVKR